MLSSAVGLNAASFNASRVIGPSIAGLLIFLFNLEAYCAPGYHPMADGIALEGMRLINKWLLEAVNNGSNIEARMNMLTAASMGSTAFQKG